VQRSTIKHASTTQHFPQPMRDLEQVKCVCVICIKSILAGIYENYLACSMLQSPALWAHSLFPLLTNPPPQTLKHTPQPFMGRASPLQPWLRAHPEEAWCVPSPLFLCTPPMPSPVLARAQVHTHMRARKA